MSFITFFKKEYCILRCLFPQLVFLGSRLHSIEDKDGVADGRLGGTLLWGGRGLGRGAGGGRGGGGTFQGTQSLAEPGVFRCLDLVHQDATLVLQLLERVTREAEEWGWGAGWGTLNFIVISEPLMSTGDLKYCIICMFRSDLVCLIICGMIFILNHLFIMSALQLVKFTS